MGIIYLSIWAVCILVLVGIYQFVKRYFSDEPKIVKATFWIVILIPTYDIILTVVLGGLHCLTTNSTYIHKKVEYPISVYWEDNVYPGFSKDDRELMIKNYLDGIHLKTMALNAPDGKIYVYHCQKDKELYEKSQREKQRIEQKLKQLNKESSSLFKKKIALIVNSQFYTQSEYEKLPQQQKQQMLDITTIWPWLVKNGIKNSKYRYVKNTKEIQELTKKIKDIEEKEQKIKETTPNYFPNFTQQCQKSEKIFTKHSIPKLNYTVTFNEVKLNPLSRLFLYSDETNIIENKTGKTIAHNQMVMPLWFNAYFFIDNNQYYMPFTICGDTSDWLDRKVFGYFGQFGSSKHVIGENTMLYKKYIKGEK